MRISGWKSKLLSQAGRACLVKSVVTALPTYFMSSFLLLKSNCQELDSIMRKFWWGFPQEKSRNFVSRVWDALCWPKEVRGLGFRKFYDYNRALISKMGWFLCAHREKFWVRVIRAKYGRSELLSLPSVSTLASWWWQGIVQFLPLLEKGLCFLVGERPLINCWKDPWVPFIPSFKPQLRSLEVDLNLHQTMGDLICAESFGWNSALILDLF